MIKEVIHFNETDNSLPFKIELPKNFESFENEKLAIDRFNFNLNGEEYSGEIKLRILPSKKMPAGLEFSVYKDEKKVAYFAATQFNEFPGEEKPFWQIYTRRVEKEYRRKGLATISLRALEKLMIEYNETRESKVEQIKIETSLASLTKLIIDQDWLAKYPEFAKFKHDKINLGYVPETENINLVKKVLENDTEELDDLNKNNYISPLKMVKKI